jgi:hypothetical protein
MVPKTSGNREQKSRMAARLQLLVVSLLMASLFAEVTLRVIGYSFPNFYMIDPDRGVALRPGMEGWYRKEGETYIRINGDGLRDREHTKQKPADTVRIAVVGDSYAEAFQVPVEDAFWHIMEERLQGCQRFGRRKVEVLNFGVSGYGTAQELITLQKHVWNYQPDIVLLAVTTNNDITDNLRALKQTDQVPYFILRDGKLTLDDSFKSNKSFRWRQSSPARLGSWIFDHSRVIQLTARAMSTVKYYFSHNSAPAAFLTVHAQAQDAVGSKASEEVGIDNKIYCEPATANWEEAWHVTESLIPEMDREVKARGAEFLVVTLSNGIQVLPDPAARAAFMRRVGSTDIFYPDKRLKSLGEREGFTVFNLAPDLQAYADEHKAFLHGFGKDLGNGHWNQLGHRVAGELLADKLCGEIPK